MQRLSTTKSAETCKRSVMLQAGLNVPTSLLLNFAGIMVFASPFSFRPSAEG